MNWTKLNVVKVDLVQLEQDKVEIIIKIILDFLAQYQPNMHQY